MREIIDNNKITHGWGSCYVAPPHDGSRVSLSIDIATCQLRTGRSAAAMIQTTDFFYSFSKCSTELQNKILTFARLLKNNIQLGERLISQLKSKSYSDVMAIVNPNSIWGAIIDCQRGNLTSVFNKSTGDSGKTKTRQQIERQVVRQFVLSEKATINDIDPQILPALISALRHFKTYTFLEQQKIYQYFTGLIDKARAVHRSGNTLYSQVLSEAEEAIVSLHRLLPKELKESQKFIDAAHVLSKKVQNEPMNDHAGVSVDSLSVDASDALGDVEEHAMNARQLMASALYGNLTACHDIASLASKEVVDALTNISNIFNDNAMLLETKAMAFSMAVSNKQLMHQCSQYIRGNDEALASAAYHLIYTMLCLDVSKKTTDLLLIMSILVDSPQFLVADTRPLVYGQVFYAKAYALSELLSWPSANPLFISGTLTTLADYMDELDPNRLVTCLSYELSSPHFNQVSAYYLLCKSLADALISADPYVLEKVIGLISVASSKLPAVQLHALLTAQRQSVTGGKVTSLGLLKHLVTRMNRVSVEKRASFATLFFDLISVLKITDFTSRESADIVALKPHLKPYLDDYSRSHVIAGDSLYFHLCRCDTNRLHAFARSFWGGQANSVAAVTVSGVPVESTGIEIEKTKKAEQLDAPVAGIAIDQDDFSADKKYLEGVNVHMSAEEKFDIDRQALLDEVATQMKKFESSKTGGWPSYHGQKYNVLCKAKACLEGRNLQVHLKSVMSDNPHYNISWKKSVSEVSTLMSKITNFLTEHKVLFDSMFVHEVSSGVAAKRVQEKENETDQSRVSHQARQNHNVDNDLWLKNMERRQAALREAAPASSRPTAPRPVAETVSSEQVEPMLQPA